MRCMFCGIIDFKKLDDVMEHQMIVTSEGKPICSGLHGARMSSDIFELNPLVAGFKYAPKDHNGIFIVYTANGQLMKDPKGIGANQLVRHILHSPSHIT